MAEHLPIPALPTDATTKDNESLQPTLLTRARARRPGNQVLCLQPEVVRRLIFSHRELYVQARTLTMAPRIDSSVDRNVGTAGRRAQGPPLKPSLGTRLVPVFSGIQISGALPVQGVRPACPMIQTWTHPSDHKFNNIEGEQRPTAPLSACP